MRLAAGAGTQESLGLTKRFILCRAVASPSEYYMGAHFHGTQATLGGHTLQQYNTILCLLHHRVRSVWPSRALAGVHKAALVMH